MENLFNPIALIVAALVPLLIGYIWYNPKVMGTAWQKETGLTDKQLQEGNMLKIFGISIILSLFLAFFLIASGVIIHQWGAMGMIGGEVETAKPSFAAFMQDYGMAHRSIQHGLLHGMMVSVLFMFPILATNGMFEQKSWKHIFINAGYWMLCLMIMGAIISAWV